jgi:hypothetical protein
MGVGGRSFPILAETEIEDALLECRQNLRSRFVEHTPKMPECILENNGLSSYLFALFIHLDEQSALDWQNGGAWIERKSRGEASTLKNTGTASGALEASGAGALPNMTRRPPSTQTTKKRTPTPYLFSPALPSRADWRGGQNRRARQPNYFTASRKNSIGQSDSCL